MATKLKSIEGTLTELYTLQLIDSKIDQIEILKGALPIEVSDLEDEIVGLETRLVKTADALDEVKHRIAQHKANIKEAEQLIERYEKQLEEVKNNREYDALTKEIELQKLEIQLSEKKIREADKIKEVKAETKKAATEKIDQKKTDLEDKKVELEKILSKTNKEEASLIKKSKAEQKNVEERLLASYHRIRERYRNGLAVVTIKREACGGCFARIPPQVRIEIGQLKQVVACEHCGRVLIDDELAEKVAEAGSKKRKKKG